MERNEKVIYNSFRTYKENEKRDVVRNIGNDMLGQSRKCGENCRYVMAAVFVALWTFMQHEENEKARLALAIIMSICVLFMLINTWRYYFVAKKCNDLYRNSLIIDDKILEYKMTEISDFTFWIQGLEVFICTIVVLLLIAYVVLRFVIYM